MPYSFPILYTYILKRDDEMLGFFELLQSQNMAETNKEISELLVQNNSKVLRKKISNYHMNTTKSLETTGHF